MTIFQRADRHREEIMSTSVALLITLRQVCSASNWPTPWILNGFPSSISCLPLIFTAFGVGAAVTLLRIAPLLARSTLQTNAIRNGSCKEEELPDELNRMVGMSQDELQCCVVRSQTRWLWSHSENKCHWESGWWREKRMMPVELNWKCVCNEYVYVSGECANSSIRSDSVHPGLVCSQDEFHKQKTEQTPNDMRTQFYSFNRAHGTTPMTSHD